MNSLLRFTTAIGLTLAAGCATTPKQLPATNWPAFAPARPGETLHRVDPNASRLLIQVTPEGPMARLGHSHIIGGSAISGIVITGASDAAARLDLHISTAALDVDRPEWRAAGGLKSDLDDAAISGTRANMRGESVLDVEHHPEISIRSVGTGGPAWMPDVTVRIRLRGVVREVNVPVAVERKGAVIRAVGAFDLLQSDFGIEPFSTAGGALRVSDRMRIRFRIIATAVRASR